MLSFLTRLTNHIPLSIRTGWRHYGVFAVFGLSLLGLWLGHGEKIVQTYFSAIRALDPDVKQRLSSGGYKLGYTLAYIVLRFVYAPQQAFPWLGLGWSMAVMHYRYVLKPFVFQGSWGLRVGYALVILIVLQLVVALLTWWTGSKVGSNAVANWGMSWCLVYGFWTYLREINQTRRALNHTATQAELTALKAQVNPHFLFNSLNNIFGTALTEGGQRTPDGVQQLSRLLRYQLEQTQMPQVTVDREIQFVDEYVQFHRLLLPPGQTLQFSSDWDEQPALLPPLLLTPLIDYALQQAAPDAAITGRLTIYEQVLSLRFSYLSTATLSDSTMLQNVRQRLMILFPDRHTFHEQVGHEQVTITLRLQLTNETYKALETLQV